MTALYLGTSWHKVYQTSRASIPIFGTNKFNPIPQLIVPIDFTSQFLTIGASSTKAKPTWNLAFYADVLTNIAGIGAVQIEHFFVPLGATLFEVKKPIDSYKLRILFPPWHTAMDIEIWTKDSP